MSTAGSWTPAESLVLLAVVFSEVFSSRSWSVRQNRRRTSPDSSNTADPAPIAVSGEREPLLADSPVHVPRTKKPFYRARPLWLVPFAITAALVRGMTLAPRVEVFTQLSCSRLHHNYNHTSLFGSESAPLQFWIDPAGRPEADRTTFSVLAMGEPRDAEDSDEDDPRQLPSARCMSDPAVQSGAARIQTMFTTTMGLLSALTTGWWGHFGERHGRTKVLAIATFGLFLTDLAFILASTPSSPLASHGHTLLLIAPVIEGLLGGWSTLQSGTSAYISDCTSSGSRAAVFSRFTGVSFLGFALGPLIGRWLIQHPIAFLTSAPHRGQRDGQSVMSVFWVAVCCSFINLCLVLFVFPESVTQEQRDLASGRSIKGKGRGNRASEGTATPDDTDEQAVEEAELPRKTGIIRAFLGPLAIFLPTPIFIDGSSRKRKDWSLTLLACAMFGYMLSAGLYQIKYLYGTHVYSWGPAQLSMYISFMGGGRALFLLFVFPLVISTFKPKSELPKVNSADGTKAVKPKPTKAHLAQEIKFDLRLARISLLIDIVANLSIVLAPAPSVRMHSQFFVDPKSPAKTSSEFRNSQALFVVASWIACWGAGLVPAVQSLALCIVQARALLEADAAPPTEGAVAVVDAGAGRLFGALAVLQATGQMILGPLLFGLVYSGTVATFPKAVFVTAIGILFVALTATLLVRSPLAEARRKSGSRRRFRTVEEEEERGRSRVSKDLRGYGSTSMQGSPPVQGPSSSGSS
ncbi:major facilitator superfamily domain-containing protein [Mycena sp. CBHHK59/15]|nr:major facilitator superfamily domain-containing protein [Mycena sp. CBHHK59/15]